MPVFDSLDALPEGAVGTNGRPSLMLSPMGTADFALPTLAGNGVKGLRVFKTGPLKDSKGRERTWSREDLEQMVANFSLLRSKNILPNVPVRENHSRDVRMVGGYFAGLSVSVDTDERGNHFLEADIDFTEPEMQARYERGTYRNRSIEIGAYETNTGEIYFPVVLGLAFCDIPAVEGLYAAALSAYESNEKPEIMVYAPVNGADASGKPPAPPAQKSAQFDSVITSLQSILQGEENPDGQNALQKVIQAVEALKGATAQPAAPATTHASGAEMPETFKFALDGAEIEIAGDANTLKIVESLYSKNTTLATENTALKTQVSEFEAAAVQAAEDARLAAVDSWLEKKKITPAQVEPMKAYVKTLTDEQFTAHAALTLGTPDLAFTKQEDPTGGDNEQQAREATIRTHRQTYEMLKFSGLPAEKLAESKPAKALAALNVPVEV